MNATTAVWRRVRRVNPEDNPLVESVLARRDFLALLQRERARVARNSHVLSLVAFRYPGGNGHGEATEDARFLRLLLEKIRLTDTVGILARDEVGVFLPETACAGAQVFARRVCQGAAEWGAHPEHTVYCYPEERPAGKDNDPRQMLLEPIAELWKKTGIGGSGTRSADSGDGKAASLPPAEGMRRYLARPLPVWKRVFDVAAAVAGLVVFSPLMLLIALHIKATSPGPVLFRQERIGYLGRRFRCLKFRTMHVNCDESAHRTHLHDLIRSSRAMVKLEEGRDSRIIPFGKTLRRAGLDELPQLVNVLFGDMSFVGPRPCIPYEYDEFDPWHRMRTEALPGLTGLWQVSGKNKTTFTEMIRYDIAYARRLSLWLDVWIVLRTVPALAAQFRN